jgi:hypothetical protein
MGNDPLEKLAAKGRRLKAEEREAKKRARSESATAATREARQQLRASVSWFVNWGWWVAGALVGAAWMLLAQYLPETFSLAASLAGAGIPVLLFRMLRPWIGELSIAREEARVRALPFPVVGYFEALASARTEGRASLTIRFAPSDAVGSSENERLADVFRAIGAKLGESAKPGERRVYYEVDFGESSALTNAHLAAWLRRAIRVLELVHPTRPIAEVSVAGFE